MSKKKSVPPAAAVFLLLGGLAAAGEELPSLRLVADEDGDGMVFLDREGDIVGILAPAATEAVLAAAPAQMPGWPFEAGEVESTPRVADIDGDGRMEVVFGSFDGNLYVVDEAATLAPGWPLADIRTGRSASLADVDGDGALEIFLAGGASLGGGKLVGVRHDGISLPGWPQESEKEGFADPAIGDLDVDGRIEIAAMEGDGMAHLWGSDGKLVDGWPYVFSPSFAESNKGPALGDVDADGILDVAFPLAFDPALYVFSIGGTILPGFPVLDSPFGLRQGVSMADMDSDGAQELVFEERSGAWIVEGDGTTWPGWPVAAPSPLGIANTPPAIGDLDRDGRLEMVWATIGGDAVVFVLREDGTFPPGWPVTVPGFSFNSQATLGDIDGDGAPDIVIGGFTSGFGVVGRIYAWHANGTPVSGFPFEVPEGKSILASSVTITDLDQDGDVDLLVGTITGLGGTTDGRVFAFDLEAPYDPSTMEWPTLGHDNRHTARYEPPPRRVGVFLSPPILHLDAPAPVVLLHATLPAELASLPARFELVRIGGQTVSLEGSAVGPPPGAGPVRLTQFDGAALSELVRATVGNVPGAVPLEFVAEATPSLLGLAILEVR